MSEKVVLLSSAKKAKLPTSASELELKISTSTGNQGRVSNRNTTWAKLCEKLSKPAQDSATMKEYLALPIREQDKRKNQGYFVGGQFTKGVRKITAISERTLLTFDVDNCTPGLLADLRLGSNWIGQFQYFLYTTRKHTAEAPRIRLVVPINATISTPKYTPLTRIMAEKIDPEMVAVDPVSFRPAQIMYWPTICRDGEFIAEENEGTLLDPNLILREYGDWQDYSKLPRSPREKSLREAGNKVTDPLTKHGIVGAFCKSYSISAAIEEFLSDVYEPGELNGDGTQRYSFIPGSTRNGAVVYDDDKHLYSHHGTDPCSDKLVNAFDMVRLHKFSDKDKPGENGEEPVEAKDAPSYKAMVEFLKDDVHVMREMRDDNTDFDAIFGDYAEEVDLSADTDIHAIEADDEDAEELDEGGEQVVVPAEVTSEVNPDWRDQLDTTEKGIIKTTLHNVIVILNNDPRFRNSLARNEFYEREVQIKRIKSKQFGHDSGPILDRANGDRLTNRVGSIVRSIIEAPRGPGKSGYGIKVSERDMKDAIEVVASSHSFHPIKSYLQACRWDGIPRVRKLFPTYAHAEDNPYLRAVAFNMLVAAVQRVFEPGCKFDFVCILEGAQGKGKSSFISILAGPGRFGELRGKLDDPAKVIEQIRRKWILEIPELSQFNSKTDIEVIKALFSSQEDTARLAYGKGENDFLRQCTFWGTTNRRVYFWDEENRRFWPVPIGTEKLDLAGLRRDRDQIWAEAYQHYLNLRRQHPNRAEPLPLFLDGKIAEFHRGLTEARSHSTADDGMLGMIQEWLDTPVPLGTSKPGWRGSVEDTEFLDKEPKVLRRVTCIKDILYHVFDKKDGEADQRLAQQVGRVMADMPGWHRKPGNGMHLGKPLGRQRVYMRDVK